MRKVIYIIAGLIIVFAIIRQCESEPKVITKTKTIVEWKTDTIVKTKIEKVSTPVYVERVITQQGKDSIVYVKDSTATSITANKFKTTLESNKATAELDIISTGEVLDVQGTITYPEKETITEITKIKDKSGFYIYGSTPINPQNFSPEVGVLYQFRNKVFISGSVQYNAFTNSPDIKAGLGIKIF